MTAREFMAQTYARELTDARAQYHDCRRKRLPVMTEHFRRQMIRAYLRLRGLR